MGYQISKGFDGSNQQTDPVIRNGREILLQGFDDSNQQTDSAAVIRNGREILLQAFNWESHKHDWWRNLEKKVPDIAKSGFTSAWLPPPTHSFSPEGYLPQNLYSLNSSYGSEHLLKALLQKLKQYNVRAMADIVINHRIGTTQGHGGMYNRYDGIPLAWSEDAVTSCSGGLAHWPFPSNHIMEGYAYILTHPGIPTVFYDHFFD